MERLQEGDRLSVYKELPAAEYIGGGKERRQHSQQGEVVPEQLGKGLVVPARAAARQIVHQKGGEQPVPIGEVQSRGEEVEHVVQVLGAEQGDPQRDGDQKDRGPPPGQPPEQGDQQHELGQSHHKVEGGGQVPPDGVPDEIGEGEPKIAVAHEIHIVDRHRQQIGQEDGFDPLPIVAPQAQGAGGQGELHSAEEEEAGHRHEGEALQADHQTVLPAAVVQYGNRLAGAVAPQDHEAKEQI